MFVVLVERRPAQLKIRCSTEQIINKLRKIEVLTPEGNSTDSVIRNIGVTRNTYYRWCKEHGGEMRVDQATHLKELEMENSWLKRLAVDLSPGDSIFC